MRAQYKPLLDPAFCIDYDVLNAKDALGKIQFRCAIKESCQFKRQDRKSTIH